MSSTVDHAELMSLLESSDFHTASQVKDLIVDQLASGKEAWLVNAVVDAFVESHSRRCLEILGGLIEPHDRHLFERLYEHWKTGNKVQVLMVIGHLACREPLWLHKIVGHTSLLGSILKGLKTEVDVTILLTGALTIVALLPAVRYAIVQILPDVFDVFQCVVKLLNNNSGSMADIHALHLRVGGNIMFQRLYGMFPCHFLAHLRLVYSKPETASAFKNVIKPMLSQVRVHPLLVTGTKEKEVIRERWKDKGVYEILVECAHLSLDLTEAGSQYGSDDQPTTQLHGVHEHRKAPLVKKISTEVLQTDVVAIGGPVGWTPSLICGYSTPPPGHPGSGVGPSPCPPVASSTSTASPLSRFSDSKPAPLVMPSSNSEDSSVPSTPILEPQTPKRHSSTFEFTRPAAAVADDSALDLSGRFMEGGLGLGLRCNMSTQTDGESVAIHIQPPTERSTSTEDAVVNADSDSSSSPLTSAKTPASVAAFVKRVKRIRFNSITVSKDLPMQSSYIVPPRSSLQRSNSCPDLMESSFSNTSDADSSSLTSLSRQRHCMTIGSPIISSVRSTCEMQVSPMIIDKATVGTQTSLFVYSMEPDALTEYPLVPYELLIALTHPCAPFIQCYACLHGQAEGDFTGSIKSFSQTPYYASYSPSDLLDRHLDAAVKLHAARSRQPSGEPSIEVLTNELRLLHAQLMFERHKRDIHARCTRRLLSRMAYLQSLAEQNEAMKDQLRLQETELNKMKSTLLTEQQLGHNLRTTLEKQHTDDEAKIRSLTFSVDELTAKVLKLETCVSDQKAAKVSQDRELELARHELFLKDKDLELLRQKSDGATQLKDQVTQMNTELLLMGELHQKYQQRLAETTNQHSGEIINLKLGLESSTAAYAELKSEMTAKADELEVTKMRLAEMERQLMIKDILIEEQKGLLEHTKTEYNRKLDMAQERNKGNMKIISAQQQRILELLNELGMHNNQHTQQKGAAAVQATQQGQQPPVTAAPSLEHQVASASSQAATSTGGQGADSAAGRAPSSTSASAVEPDTKS